jgi:signal transduction histidine kinase
VTHHRWAAGTFCAALGALMLVTPHQFSAAFYVLLQPYLAWWGGVFLLAGAALITVPVLDTTRGLVIVSHLCAGVVLLLLAWGFAGSGAPSGVAVYAALGISTVVAPFLGRPKGETVLHGTRFRHAAAVDLLSVVLGVTAALLGLLLLAQPQQFTAAVYDPIRWALPYQGAAFVMGGIALLVTQGLPAPPRWARWGAHVVTSGAYLAYCALVAIPARNLTGVAYYGGFGVVLVLLPWLTSRLRQVEPRSLSTRLVLANIWIAAVPLIIAVALLANQAERLGSEQALGTQRVLAESLARDVSRYVNLHRAVASGLARYPGLSAMPAAEQEALLVAIHASYPDLTLLAIGHADGTVVARSDGGTPLTVAGLAMWEQLQRTRAPVLVVVPSRITQRPIVSFGYPLVDDQGQLAGMVGGGVEVATLAQTIHALSAEGHEVYLVDAGGRVVVHSDATLVEPATDVSGRLPVAAMLPVIAGSGSSSGSLRFASPYGNRLASYATMPQLNWGVVVEQPTSFALGSVNAGRDVAAIVLLAAIGVAGTLGLLFANRLARPLASLTQAMDSLATGAPGAMLPRRGPTEVRRLTQHFHEMRERLSGASAEQARLLQSERDARTAAEHASRLREQFLSVAAHELKTPVTTLRGYAQLCLRRLRQAGRTTGGATLDLLALSRALERIDQQSGRMARLIEQLLDVSRMGLGRLRLEPEPADLASLVHTAASLAQSRTSLHTIDVHAPDRLPAVFDPLRLEQVLDNLLDNAIKFSPDGGAIEVALSEPTARQVQLSVRDHGLGIPPEHRHLIFERFFQAHDDSHRSGLGLGLWVSREIVELHGGAIHAEFPVDGGVRFDIVLPRTPTGPPVVEPQNEDIADLERSSSAVARR